MCEPLLSLFAKVSITTVIKACHWNNPQNTRLVTRIANHPILPGDGVGSFASILSPPSPPPKNKQKTNKTNKQKQQNKTKRQQTNKKNCKLSHDNLSRLSMLQIKCIQSLIYISIFMGVPSAKLRTQLSQEFPAYVIDENWSSEN